MSCHPVPLLHTDSDLQCVRLDGPSKYTNLAGNIVTTLPFRPAPNARNAPHQVEGWYDPSGMIDNPEPWMLDEMVANYRGDPPQVHPGGQGGNWMMQVQEEPEANGTEPVYEGPGVIIPLNPIWEAWACGEPCCIGQ
jgi:hypothetical protein